MIRLGFSISIVVLQTETKMAVAVEISVKWIQSGGADKIIFENINFKKKTLIN